MSAGVSKEHGYTTELDLYKTVNLYNTIQYTSAMDGFIATNSFHRYMGWNNSMPLVALSWVTSAAPVQDRP